MFLFLIHTYIIGLGDFIELNFLWNHYKKGKFRYLNTYFHYLSQQATITTGN